MLRYSALLHFALIELSPIPISYVSLRGLVVDVITKKRESLISIADFHSEVARLEADSHFNASYTLQAYNDCLRGQVRADLWKSPHAIRTGHDVCGQLDISMDRRHASGLMGLSNQIVFASASIAFLGNIVLFCINGAFKKASDWQSGRYLAFTWDLESMKMYQVLVGLHVFCCTFVNVGVVAMWILHHDGRGMEIVRSSLAEVTILFLSLFHLLKEDRPPIEYNTEEFHNSIFQRPWYKFYVSNSRFTVKEGFRAHWLAVHGTGIGFREPPREGFADLGKCHDHEFDSDSSEMEV